MLHGISGTVIKLVYLLLPLLIKLYLKSGQTKCVINIWKWAWLYFFNKMLFSPLKIGKSLNQHSNFPGAVCGTPQFMASKLQIFTISVLYWHNHSHNDNKEGVISYRVNKNGSVCLSKLRHRIKCSSPSPLPSLVVLTLKRRPAKNDIFKRQITDIPPSACSISRLSAQD